MCYWRGCVWCYFYPHESELSRRVKQLIRAAKKQLEALCAMK
ncbi:hypothetical protein E7U89_04740 [Escherichia coli]|nr:hypothetical protein [Escherichia coli]